VLLQSRISQKNGLRIRNGLHTRTLPSDSTWVAKNWFVGLLLELRHKEIMYHAMHSQSLTYNVFGGEGPEGEPLMVQWLQLRDVYSKFTSEMIGKAIDDFASWNFLIRSDPQWIQPNLRSNLHTLQMVYSLSKAAKLSTVVCCTSFQ